MPRFGTLLTLDTLRSGDVSTSLIVEIGEDKVFATIEAERVAHNAIVREMLSEYAEFSADRLRRYGGTSNMDMEDIDEVGSPQAQKVAAGATVAFPLSLSAIGVQWTRKFMENATGKELAVQFTATQDADVRKLQLGLKRAIFVPTNYTFTDRLVDGASLAVKRLVNADSAPIPPGPNGEVFVPATHTHYLFTVGVALAAADVAALVNTVVEHYSAGRALVYINRAEEAAFRGFTAAPNMFVPYVDARLIQPDSATRTAQALDITQLNNRAIGIFNQAEVWVKPWVPAGYIWCWLSGVPLPLVARTRAGNDSGLSIAAEFDSYPLRARALEREIGFGIWNRTNGAVLYIDTGAAGAYVAPTLT